MVDPVDTSGLAFAALALSTASLAAAVRRGEMSVSEMREIVADAHALVHDRAGFIVDAEATQAADDFLSAAEALALPDATRMPDDNWRPSREGAPADNPTEGQSSAGFKSSSPGRSSATRGGRADQVRRGVKPGHHRVTAAEPRRRKAQG